MWVTNNMIKRGPICVHIFTSFYVYNYKNRSLIYAKLCFRAIFKLTRFLSKKMVRAII